VLIREEVSPKEGELIGDDELVLWAVVDIEVIDSRVGLELSPRGATCRRDRRPRLGHPV
jgi:hypothetical protein